MIVLDGDVFPIELSLFFKPWWQALHCYQYSKGVLEADRSQRAAATVSVEQNYSVATE